MPTDTRTTGSTSPGVRALIAELGEMPSRPTVAMRVLQLLDDPRTDATRLGKLVETDPALAAHTLRLANAPANGISRRIASARHAVMVLGFELVRSLAALNVGGLLGSSKRPTPAGFWEHSLAVAGGAQVVARHTGRSEGEACSAGLLHDLGAALLHRVAPARYEELVAATPDDPIARAVAEAGLFEMTHAEAGAAVLGAWHFPAEVLEAVHDHHRLPVPSSGDLVLVVRAGESLADLVEVIDAGESIPDPVEALAAAGIRDPDLDSFVEETKAQIESISSVLG